MAQPKDERVFVLEIRVGNLGADGIARLLREVVEPAVRCDLVDGRGPLLDDMGATVGNFGYYLPAPWVPAGKKG